MGVRQNFTGPHDRDNGRTPCRMLKKAVQQGRSKLSLNKGVAGTIPTARNVLTRPPTDTPRRAICPGEGLLVFLTSPSGEQPDCPSLRASDEHRFIVRVLRAQRMVWLLPLLLF
jgi:hypothetical protein